MDRRGRGHTKIERELPLCDKIKHLSEPTPSIFAGPGALARFDGWLGETASAYSAIYFLVDANTAQHCLVRLAASLEQLPEFEMLEIPAGEEQKSWEVACQLLSALAELGADRRALLIALGGGVVTDLGGFVASIYKRGIDHVLVPTSLLGMTDAAIGGKNGVDLDGAKNLAGIFRHPRVLVVWPDFLDTLPEEFILDGRAESIKHGLIADAAFWEELKRGEEVWTAAQVERSMAIKTEICAEDLLELGKRKLLNFGHTVGHALESHMLQSGAPWSHGRCVAAGMCVEIELSVELLGFPLSKRDEVNGYLIDRFGLSELKETTFSQWRSWLSYDKKNAEGQWRFVLLKDVGEAKYDQPVTPKQLDRAWTKAFQ